MSRGLQAIREGQMLGRILRSTGPALHTELPDSDITVLAVTTDPECPVWPCFHDGETWRTCDASTLHGSGRGWMHLEEAAAVLVGEQKGAKGTKV
jgi:hypothetical protein